MSTPKDEDELQPLRDVAGAARQAVDQFLRSLTDFAGAVSGHNGESLTGDELERRWRTLRKHHRRVEARFADLSEAVEDAADVSDARAALLEPGDQVPWEDVKAELGLS